MDIRTDTRRVSRLEIVEAGCRRRWTKQSCASWWRVVGDRGWSRYWRVDNVSRTDCFLWRRAYREGRLGEVSGFVPAIVAPDSLRPSIEHRAKRVGCSEQNRNRVFRLKNS